MYPGYDIQNFYQVFSWQDCNVKCTLTKGCTAWTWGSPQMSDSGWHNRCFTKTSDADKRPRVGLISGQVGCKDDGK